MNRGGGDRTGQADLAAWLLERSPGVAERWAEALTHERGAWRGGSEALARPFCRSLVRFLPPLLGPYRSQLLPLWAECAELYGSVAARRGLAAGEVVEEFQLLREVIVRALFQRPPRPPPGAPEEHGPGGALALRETLLLNRAIDVGVTQASVGHTDLLFFSLIDGSGAPAPLSAADLDEIRAQIRALRREGEAIANPRARTEAPR